MSYQQPPAGGPYPPQGPPPPLYPPPGPPPGQPYRGGYEPFDTVPFDLAILGLGFLALVFSHFAFYRIPAVGDVGFNLDAYHGFFGWAGVWLVAVGAAAVAVPLFGRRVSSLRLIGLCVATLGLVLLIVTIFVRPDFGYCDRMPFGCTNPVKVGVSFWIDFVLAIGVVGLLGFTVAKAGLSKYHRGV